MFWRRARLIIPTTFDECLTYGQRQDFMEKQIIELQERVTALENVSRETQIDEEPET